MVSQYKNQIFTNKITQMNKNLLQFLSIILVVLISTTTSFAQKQNVNVTDFTVSTKAQKVVIDWKTDGATTTNYFAIQKSTDGVNYTTVALVMGPDPKQKGECYGCSDKLTNKSAKHSYYRLIHVDTNGNEQVTAVKELATP